jgi:hypothetical protein
VKTSMAGFAAQTLLYKRSEHYQMAHVIAALKSERAVVPQHEMSVIDGVSRHLHALNGQMARSAHREILCARRRHRRVSIPGDQDVTVHDR